MPTTKSSTITYTLSEQTILYGALQKPPELDMFIDFMFDHEPQVVVEIGTALGGMFWLLCQLAANNAIMVSLDLVGGIHGAKSNEWASRKTLERHGRRQQKVRLVRGNSHYKDTKDKLITALRGKKIDLLFIDGDHTYPGVKRDYELYRDLVAPGGLIAFHDIAYHDREDVQVDKLWGEIKDSYVHHEFVDERGGTWGGIGVLEIPSEKVGASSSE